MPCLISRRALATILVVDVSNNLRLAFQYIKDAGHKTVITHSSQKAIVTARTLQPDLILLACLAEAPDCIAIAISVG